MVHTNSQNELKLIAAVLRDVQNEHGAVFNTTARRDTYNYVARRYREEGLSFLTKTLPKLGKALDRALASDTPLDVAPSDFRKKVVECFQDCLPILSKDTKVEFARSLKGLSVDVVKVHTKLPQFMWELTSRVFEWDGLVLQNPCSSSVKVIRQICFLFYKYKLPYSDEQEHAVISSFEKTEDELQTTDTRLQEIARRVLVSYTPRLDLPDKGDQAVAITHGARSLLYRLFASFDPTGDRKSVV